MKAHDGVLFQFLVVLRLHLRYVAIECCEVLACKEAELKLRVELLEYLRRALIVLQAEGIGSTLPS